MRCQLCGYEFDERQMACRASCALNPHCAIICCPQCGYQAVDESKTGLALALRRWLDRKSRRPAVEAAPVAARRLSDLQPGQSGLVVALESRSEARLNRLSTLGLTPGAHITLEQRRPAYVLRVGFTELSIEREVADEIWLEAG